MTHDGGVNVVRRWKEKYKNVVKFGRIRIGNNCFIGTNAVIMSDVVIGDNCVIALGSVVTHDIPDGEVWGGIPAKRLCSIEEYAEKNLALTPEHDAKYLAEHFREETTRIADERSALRRSHSQKNE